MSEADVTEQVARREIHGTVNLTAATAGLYDDRGDFDASGDLFPTSGGSGDEGAVLKGDAWTISVAGTLGGTDVISKDWIFAKVDTPGQNPANWNINEAAGGSDFSFEGPETPQAIKADDQLLLGQIDLIISGALPVEFNGRYPFLDILNGRDRYKMAAAVYNGYWDPDNTCWTLGDNSGPWFRSTDGDVPTIFDATTWEAINPEPGVINGSEIDVNASAIARAIDKSVLFYEPPFEALTEGDPTTWTFAGRESQNKTLLLTADGSLNIVGMLSGGSGTLIVKQDGTGGHTLALPGHIKLFGGTAYVPTAAANAVDILSFFAADDAGLLYCAVGKDFKE